jgi:hypothetical protein
MKKITQLATVALLCLCSVNLSAANDAEYRRWVVAMKEAPRGPFSRIRWFCHDGAVLAPEAYACAKHGGGVQHGEYTANTQELRDNGYYIANLLAGEDIPALVDSANFNDRYSQILIEKFLTNADNGWILRRAQYYRGAYQEETERSQARKLFIEMLARDEWHEARFASMRIGVRLLPHGQDSASAQKVRQLAAALAKQDSDFMTLRVKIHGSPDAKDEQLVRDFASLQKDPTQYIALADEIHKLYSAAPLSMQLRQLSTELRNPAQLQTILLRSADDFKEKITAQQRYQLSAQLLADLRDQLALVKRPEDRLKLLELSLTVESENFTASTELRQQIDSSTRAQRIVYLHNALQASYGVGLINKRLLDASTESISKLQNNELALAAYLNELSYLGRAPGWGTQALRFHFYQSMEKLAHIEPLAMMFIQDQLRGGPLMFFSANLDGLSRDANQLAGVKHKIFGRELGVGFHALNPGLARGKLHVKLDMNKQHDIEADGIYVLPETVSDLPPLAGIITAGEGNPLSHVQLLARNLGIPNVTIDPELITKLSVYDGKTVVLAVSPSGLVELHQDSPEWQRHFARPEVSSNVIIRPDLEKLDLSVRRFINLKELVASDSGRIVGPKAAKLGELYHHFPEKVADGVAIPFGLFRETVLDKPYKNSGKTVFQWMEAQYANIHSQPEASEQRAKTAEAFRAELYNIIMQAQLSDTFKRELATTMKQTFGRTDIGVFVRSDTNVEDLPGFTGAGLNLTLPNVIGIDGVLAAINKVWASPFTARAFAWRQSHMEKPQHVYPAILLLQSVANEKSGVMVTQNIDSGDMNTLSVAVNEGVGGAVDGQSAESLRINIVTGEVKVLATATAPWQRKPSANGGISTLASSGANAVLQPKEIAQLIRFAKDLPTKFPPIIDDKGNRAAADIEFGFINGELHLFQLRPFLQSERAQGNKYLKTMDQSLQGNLDRTVNMNQEV